MTCPVCNTSLTGTQTMHLVSTATGVQTDVTYAGCVLCQKVFQVTPAGPVEEHITKVTTSVCPFCSGHLVIVNGRPTGCLNCGQEAS